jgi:hypothetical protein
LAVVGIQKILQNFRNMRNTEGGCFIVALGVFYYPPGDLLTWGPVITSQKKKDFLYQAIWLS